MSPCGAARRGAAGAAYFNRDVVSLFVIEIVFRGSVRCTVHCISAKYAEGACMLCYLHARPAFVPNPVSTPNGIETLYHVISNTYCFANA